MYIYAPKKKKANGFSEIIRCCQWIKISSILVPENILTRKYGKVVTHIFCNFFFKGNCRIFIYKNELYVLQLWTFANYFAVI